MKRRSYQVREVARIAGVSTRTLRYYDELGLLVPSTRTGTGYRLYDDADLLRLHQIMVGRELGLPLEDIRRLLDDPNLDRRALLLEQRSALVARANTAAAMIRSVDRVLKLLHETDQRRTTPMDIQEIFTGINPHEAEARERWGGTESYEESVRRGRNYTAGDWHNIGGEWHGIMNDAAAAMAAGARPDAPQAMDIAERYRLWLTRWFFVCSPARHAAMADMFEADVRFAQTVNQYAQGLAPYWSAAIRANARRCLESGSDAAPDGTAAGVPPG
jgi:MerR family transcriptional regulator, thiopeptide resistance regulator